jgi:hypothetical protein
MVMLDSLTNQLCVYVCMCVCVCVRVRVCACVCALHVCVLVGTCTRVLRWLLLCVSCWHCITWLCDGANV